MYGPVKKLSRVTAGIQQTIAACQRIFHLLDTHTEVIERPGAPPLARLRTEVEFHDVGFAYEDDPTRFILRHVSFTARAGQVVAIVGLSGAGKTTLVNLIPRFYDVTDGAILIDGVDIRTVTLRSLRDQMALVTQETVLFDDTIAANIAFGVPQATRDEIIAAATAAHAHEFIVPLPRGYDTQDWGARAAAVGRPAAAARDRAGDSQELARSWCSTKRRRRSTPNPSCSCRTPSRISCETGRHSSSRTGSRPSGARISSSRSKKGEVAEIGSHDELVSRPGGVYARLYALQAFDERDREADVEVADLAREVPS